MKTTVIMKRELMGGEISQDSKNGFFSATDLIRIGNKIRVEKNMPLFNLNTYLLSKNVKEFMQLLSEQEGEIKINSKGKNQHTWVHPYLFIDIALSMNPDLKVVVYKWIFDKLVEYRNLSGDSYKKMAGALYLSISNKSEFKDTLVDYAKKIKDACKVDDWQTASESQLKLRDKIHEYVSLLSDIIREKNNLIEVCIKKATEENK